MARLSRRPLALEALEDRVVPANASGVFSGTAFIDVNGNGRFDAGDLLLPAQQISLTGTTIQGTPISTVATSDANGSYTFLNVLPGTYQMSAALGAGSGIPSGPAGVDVVSGLSVVGGDSFSQNFGFKGLSPAFISLKEFLSNSTPMQFLQSVAGSGTGLANFRPNNAPFVKTAIQAVSVGKNAADTKIDLAANFSDPDITDSMVRIDTTDGPINVELFDTKAPQTVANFLNYVQSGAYNNSVFHRLAFNPDGTPFVLQGGGFSFNAGSLNPIPENPPVANEFGMSNVLGTLAMAKKGGDPNSATNQFFFNLGNNSSNLDNQNGGFTVFGKLVGAADQAVVNALAATPVSTTHPSPFDQIPLNNYNGTNFPTDATDANFIKILDVVVLKHDENLTYSVVTNDNPGLVTAATLANDNPILNLSYVHNQVGTAHVTVRATDRYGVTVDATVTVTVANQAPTATVTLAPVNSISPQVTDTLTATATASDPNGDPVNLTYVWQVNGNTVKTTANVTSLTDTLDLTGKVKPGDTVTVSVTPNDGSLNGTPASASAPVQKPAAGAVTINPRNLAPITTTLTATLNSPNAKSFTYVWSINGTAVQTDNTANTSDTLTHAFNTGDKVLVTVTPINGTFTGDPATDTITVNAPAATLMPLTPSNPKATDTVTATVTTASDPNNDPIKLTYNWLVNSTPVQTTTLTSNLTDALNLGAITTVTVKTGDTITVRVTPNNGTIDGPVVTSSVTVA
jgi:cyclophilin family peptidyl-prolyl cis-trans isomerase